MTRWWRGTGRRDEGSAIIVVVGVLAITTLFLLTSLAYVIKDATPARKDKDSKIALAAAQAGLDEYVSRLNADNSYWEQGNSDAGNTAFGATGRIIQGTGTSGARYTYQVLSTSAQVAQTGVIRVKVTGISSGGNSSAAVSRSLIASLKPKGFLSYVYLSDIEIVDPDIVGASSSCKVYYWQWSGRANTSCNNIQWGGTDTVNGPLHSNDALQINGSVNFTTTAETGWPSAADGRTKTWWGSANPPLAGTSPVKADPVAFPVANTTLLQYVSPDVDLDASTPAGPGCYYQGATKITFTGTTMTVLSPGTTNSATPARCLDVTRRTQSQSGLAIPPVIYVADSTATCTTGQVGYPAAGELYTTGSSSAVSWGDAVNYECHRGTAYVQGSVNGQVTLSAKDDVVLTGNLTVNDPTDTDVVGLIAGNCVWVWHPVKDGGWAGTVNLYTSTQVTTIQAAILALRHSFLVENWTDGSVLGTLSVTGAIAQKFRGPVGTGSGGTMVTGYAKNYDYDERLAQLQPPYFLESSTATWNINGITDTTVG